jgi:hypothetical protein
MLSDEQLILGIVTVSLVVTVCFVALGWWLDRALRKHPGGGEPDDCSCHK